MKKLIWFLATLLTITGGLLIVNQHNIQPAQQQIQITPVEPKQKLKLNITVRMPPYLNYSQTTTQLDKWHNEAPDLTERGSYGNSAQGQPLQYLRVVNKDNTPKKVVLIMASIHGNEELASSDVMAFIGGILSDYDKDQETTDVVNSRDIYFIPVVSPDSYGRSREVDGVDPNRNFPSLRNPNLQSIAPIKALQDFCIKIKPDAVISCHTDGRVYLTPYGDQNQVCSNESDYQRIVGKMASMSHYRMQRACQTYGHPILGGELDWMYRHHALSIVAAGYPNRIW